MMRLFWMFFVSGWLMAGAAHAQVQPAPQRPATPPMLRPVGGPPSNLVQVMTATGDSLWFGPLIYLAPNGTTNFLAAEAPALTSGENVVFGLDVDATPARTVLWAGLAFDAGGGSAAAGGFLFSTDGGETFTQRPPALDSPTDTTVQYGANTLPAVPTVQEESATPQSIAYVPSTTAVWVAGAASGLRRSVDNGQTWERIVLPPDTASFITPTEAYNFPLVAPTQSRQGFLNHFAYSVVVDETGTAWVGTANGFNYSEPVAGSSDRAWRHVPFDGTPNAPTGDAVVRIAEQPAPGRNPLWMASWALNRSTQRPERFGVTVVRGGGRTIEQTLLGQRIFDFAFRSTAAGDTVVYAGGDDGLFVSTDSGRSWEAVQQFDVPAADVRLPPGVGVRSLATTTGALWVGTTEGLLRTTNEGALIDGDLGTHPTWQLFRVNVPLQPETPSEAVPAVRTYAYPNPFTPSADGQTRIRYATEQAGSVTVRIYDFGMNEVRVLRDEAPQAGEHEVAWNGRGAGGLRLPNGPYFYEVQTPSATARGKILLID
ncbi:FlgD immunoglobulin-like domain containing protein [Salisaeta longa]|uniref:FlgD immunoglobulin-like domain containing protein n=1 Tax=Salisaeta longa TaxID=503170 RepID=UPI0003B32114|nr:FlgD immunoglobulin-like domain containing protein [Salisaeta longa]